MRWGAELLRAVFRGCIYIAPFYHNSIQCALKCCLIHSCIHWCTRLYTVANLRIRSNYIWFQCLAQGCINHHRAIRSIHPFIYPSCCLSVTGSHWQLFPATLSVEGLLLSVCKTKQSRVKLLQRLQLSWTAVRCPGENSWMSFCSDERKHVFPSLYYWCSAVTESSVRRQTSGSSPAWCRCRGWHERLCVQMKDPAVDPSFLEQTYINWLVKGIQFLIFMGQTSFCTMTSSAGAFL